MTNATVRAVDTLDTTGKCPGCGERDDYRHGHDGCGPYVYDHSHGDHSRCDAYGCVHAPGRRKLVGMVRARYYLPANVLGMTLHTDGAGFTYRHGGRIGVHVAQVVGTWQAVAFDGAGQRVGEAESVHSAAHAVLALLVETGSPSAHLATFAAAMADGHGGAL